jgi:hypothetical protein
MAQEGMYDSDGGEAEDDAALQEMMEMEREAREALEYEEAMHAHAEAMHEVLHCTSSLYSCCLILSDYLGSCRVALQYTRLRYQNHDSSPRLP